MPSYKVKPKTNTNSKGLDDYVELGDKVMNNPPKFNVIQIRWFEGLLKIYQNDLIEISMLSSKDPENQEYRHRQLQCATQVELLQFQIQVIKNSVV